MNIIPLQAAIGAFFVLIIMSFFVLVVGTMLTWLYLTKRHVRKGYTDTTIKQYLIRLIISIVVPMLIIAIFFTLLYIWNPIIEPVEPM